MNSPEIEKSLRRQVARPVERVDDIRFTVRRRIAAARSEQRTMNDGVVVADMQGRPLAGSSIMRRVRFAYEAELGPDREHKTLSEKETEQVPQRSRPHIELKNALPQILTTLGDGVAAFCLAADVIDAGRWRAVLPISDGLLPDTMIDLEMSPTEIRLRFMTEHALSRNAIAAYLPAFRSRLRKVIPERCTVEVVLW